ILQISPEFTPGTGVGGVAYALEREWQAQGHEVRRFGSGEAGCAFLATPAPGLRGQLLHVAHVVWFSTIGTMRARRAVRDLPADAVSICHNDALAGDVYVNHGILEVSMRARGSYWWRMIRNPLHLFTVARDKMRYRGQTHRVVVNLTRGDEDALHKIYPRIQSLTVVIGNGVDRDRFRPPTTEERKQARAHLALDPDTLVTVFVGNEFERKGLFTLVEAVAAASECHHLVVVGGTQEMLTHLTKKARQHGLDR